MRIMPRTPLPSTARSFASRSLALALLVLQTAGAPSVALAHASDQTGGAASIETRHTAQCVVLHDANRCALCHYAQMRSAAMPALRLLPAPGVEQLPALGRGRLTPPAAACPAAPSRGPPSFVS